MQLKTTEPQASYTKIAPEEDLLEILLAQQETTEPQTTDAKAITEEDLVESFQMQKETTEPQTSYPDIRISRRAVDDAETLDVESISPPDVLKQNIYKRYHHKA